VRTLRDFFIQEQMMKEDNEYNGGDKNFPIWLLGDSNPAQWEDKLDYPFDPRHPVVHNIWTPVIDVIQDRTFAEKLRIDTSRIYIRNAIQNSEYKKGIEFDTNWNNSINNEVRRLIDLTTEFKNTLKIVISFGSFSFEFARRGLFPSIIDPKPFRHWNTKNLGIEFNKSIHIFDLGKVNLIPLLHRSISGGHYLKSHKNFCNPDGVNIGSSLFGVGKYPDSVV
jgi:hypothetical protein